MPGGRPSRYTKKLGVEICEWIANNSAGLKAGCSQNDHWPTSETIREWIRHDKFPLFSALYARAKEEQAETMGEEIIYIVDNKKLNPNDKRVRMDARKWLMGKLKPKKFGDTLDITTDGAKILAPIITAIDKDGNVIDGRLK